ncbi:MAG: hypothetical protein MUC29_00145, partial [Pyrinomonadaceae bacterium]|nr:hypothetical protein [Pyrinomonadaceae bacterium]
MKEQQFLLKYNSKVMKETLLTDLNQLLADDNSSTTLILNKAIQLALLCNKESYEWLFRYHLSGLKKETTESIYKTKLKVMKMFTQDRMKPNETNYLLGSIKTLENKLQSLETDIKRQTKIYDELANRVDEDFALRIQTTIKQNAVAPIIGSLRTEKNQYVEILFKIRNRVASFVRMMEFSRENNQKNMENIKKGKVFIGHGRSQCWRDLKDFLQDRLKLEWDEYNREPTAGMAIKERLEEMLDN